MSIRFNSSLSESDPHVHPVIVLGLVRHLSLIQYDDLKCKFGSRVTAETLQNAISCLHPSPTDTCSLYLDLATVAALPLKCSRYNTTSRAHSITKLVKAHQTGVSESIVVSTGGLLYENGSGIIIELRSRLFASAKTCLPVDVPSRERSRFTRGRATRQTPQSW